MIRQTFTGLSLIRVAEGGGGGGGAKYYKPLAYRKRSLLPVEEETLHNLLNFVTLLQSFYDCTKLPYRRRQLFSCTGFISPFYFPKV